MQALTSKGREADSMNMAAICDTYLILMLMLATVPGLCLKFCFVSSKMCHHGEIFRELLTKMDYLLFQNNPVSL